MFRTRWIAGVALSAGVLLAAGETAISPDSMREWLTYLSSDDLEGRQVFTEGLGLAAAYIADELKSFGVKPGGDHGTYFQRVEVLGVKKTDRSTLTVEVNGVTKTFKGGEGITFPANLGAKRTLAIDDVQFLGYGINLGPDHNDYRDANLKGKAAIWLGANGPKGTDQQQARRRLNARASYATEIGRAHV